MKDKIKCKIIDEALAGNNLYVLRRYGHWALGASVGELEGAKELFHWKETYNHNRPNAPTLKEALDLVDAFWDSRIAEDA